MISSLGLGTLLSWLSAPLIVALAVTSGFTTYHGLVLLRVSESIAAVLTVALQTTIVLSTIQYTRAYWSAGAWRQLLTLASLLVTAFVSIFFSYFTFVEWSEASTIRETRFQSLVREVSKYSAAIQTVKSGAIAEQKKKLEDLKKHAAMALGGNLPDGRQIRTGWGPISGYYRDEAKKEESKLVSIQKTNRVETEIAEVTSFLFKLGADGLRDRSAYDHFNALLSVVVRDAAVFATAEGASLTPPPIPPAYEEFIKAVPSFSVLGHVDWLAFLLAALVDCLTVILSSWLERNPFGILHKKDRERIVGQLLQFTQWGVNSKDQLEFRLPKTEEERIAGLNDAARLFAATSLLNKGYLRRADRLRAAFAPELYGVLNEYFRKDYKP